MTWTKWLLFSGLGGLAFAAGMSVLMAPANPHLKATARLSMPADVEAMVQRACADCHSNETRWPWYSTVWPVSALIEHDVEHGRKAMNFSEWPAIETPHDARAASGLLTASCAALQSGIMPKPQYRVMHGDAQLSVAEKQRFCEWTSMEAAQIRHALSEPRP